MPKYRYKRSRRRSAAYKYSPRRKTTRNRTKGGTLRTLFAAILSVVVASVVLVGFTIFKFINAPFSKASEVSNLDTDSNLWEQDNINVLVLVVDDSNDKNSQVKSLSIVHIDNLNRNYTAYDMPLDIETEMHDENTLTLKDIYAHTDGDTTDKIDYISEYIKLELAINTDAFVIMDNTTVDELNGLLGGINPDDLSSILRLRNTFKLPGALSIFRENAITNMSVIDVYNFLRFLRNTSDGSSNLVKVNKYQLLDKENWDTLWQGNLGISNVKKESIKVLVINASQNPKIPGLANWGARIVENLGAGLLDSDNAFNEYNENVIITDNNDYATVKELTDSLNIQSVINISDIDSNKGYNPKIFRSKVTLVLYEF